MTLTQKQWVLSRLQAGPTCGTTFLEDYVPRYAARILELRQEGYKITSEPCRLHDHRSRQIVYRLAEQQQMELSL